MNRIDRAMGILLMLRSQKTVSAPALAAHFEVSVRTIHRDLAVLAELGVPVYAEMGRGGGFRLMEGYFIPPVAFTLGEALSIVLGLAFLRGLRVRPFPEDADSTRRKLLAAMPEPLRRQLARADEILGVEALPADLLHPEKDDPQLPGDEGHREREAHHLSAWLRAVVERHWLEVDYHSPYADGPRRYRIAPGAVFWDRDRWYLVGRVAEESAPRSLRADRVVDIAASAEACEFSIDVRGLLGRRWLAQAMQAWAVGAPVVVRMPRASADELARDWFYGQASMSDAGDGQIDVTFGEDNRDQVFRLVRWLGPQAELRAPVEWRSAFAADCAAMATRHGAPPAAPGEA